MKRYILTLLIYTLLCISCSSDTNECPSLLPDFVGYDGLAAIDIQEGDTQEQILSKFQFEFGNNNCDRILEFGFPVDSVVVRLHFQYPCSSTTGRYRTKHQITIRVNQTGRVLINEEKELAVDSLGNWLINNVHLVNISQAYQKSIVVIYNAHTSLKGLRTAVIEIAQALSTASNNMSLTNFDRPYCQLDSSEAETVRQDIPHKIFLDIGHIPPGINN